MASSGILPATVIDYTDRIHASKESTYISKLSEIGGIVATSRDVFVRRVDSSRDEDIDTFQNPELKLPSLRSLFVIIGGNAVFQVSTFGASSCFSS